MILRNFSIQRKFQISFVSSFFCQQSNLIQVILKKMPIDFLVQLVNLALLSVCYYPVFLFSLILPIHWQ
ncbi:hypothetical protein BC941DRAFT_423073 [Chlamydoabsidia padenii]|nr:hypothetical protein BC941DRAFT_423073 [Chlamydoabsidia padenii]